MRKVLRTGGASLAGILMLFGAAAAQAALVNFTLTGISDGSSGSPYGINLGDNIFASGTFDDSAIASGTVYFDQAHSGNTMTINAGSLTLDNTQDDNYAAGGSPKLEFDGSGNLIGLGYNVGFLDGSAFDSGTLSGWIVNDASFNLATGSWTASSFSMTPVAPVPVPAAVWLFGSGLLGTFALTRRKKRA